jgi:hypothetical protein
MKLRNFIATTIQEYLNEQQNNKSNINDNFWKWFGDSKMVKSNGTPIIFYHGTNKIFDIFKLGQKTRQSYYCDGFYFHKNSKKVYDYGNKILKCFLSIKKPFHINNETLNLVDKYSETDNAKLYINDVEQFCKYTIGYRSENNKFKVNIINDGYDGVIIENDIYIVFNPNQIKSFENDGTWDINDDNIYS